MTSNVGARVTVDPGDYADTVSAVASTLQHAQRVTVLTGAGISAESGLATFRDPEGIWSQVRPEEIATPQAFRRDPDRVWAWYAARRASMATAEPNPAHRALAEIESRVPEMTVLTQNIDGLHAAAGSQRVIELHGNIRRSICAGCGRELEVGGPADDQPRCAACGGLARPDVVWFGENLPRDALEAAWSAAEGCDIFFSVGTSAVVEPAASLPQVAKRHGAILVEVNPEATPVSYIADHVLRQPAGEVLPAVVAAAWRDA